MGKAASVRRDGDALVFAGALTRDACAALWRQAAAQTDGVRRLDLRAVTGLDSAGLALLAELAARCGGVAVVGEAPRLAELRAAYRLGPDLAYAG